MPNTPVLLVVALRRIPNAALTTSTDAPGTGAPDASSTTPDTAPEAPCGWANDAAGGTTQTATSSAFRSLAGIADTSSILLRKRGWRWFCASTRARAQRFQHLRREQGAFAARRAVLQIGQNIVADFLGGPPARALAQLQERELQKVVRRPAAFQRRYVVLRDAVRCIGRGGERKQLAKPHLRNTHRPPQRNS